MKPIILLCAENVIVDQITNKLSAIGIVDGIQSTAFPFMFSSFCFAAIYEKERDDPELIRGTAKFEYQENILIEGPIEINFQGNPRTRVITQIGGFTIPGPGEVKLKIEFDNTETAKYSIHSQLIGGPVFQQVAPQ